MILDLTQLPQTDKEADERLVRNVENYVVNKEMPIGTAKRIIAQYVSNGERFQSVWNSFLDSIGNKKLSV